MNEAASQVLNQVGAAHSCQPLSWVIPHNQPCTTGHFSGSVAADRYETEAVDIVAEWAEGFHLKPDPDAMEGTVGYHGEITGVAVEIWAVADRDDRR